MMQDLYEFVRTETGTDGNIIGNYRATGIRSTYAKHLEIAGFKADSRLIRSAEG